jgi:putative ABC transport system substrate-binding protein
MNPTTHLSLLLCVLALLTPGITPSAAQKDLKIAMITWRGETKSEQGFKDGLKELGYSVQYTVMDAGQDKTKLGHILREELQPKLKSFDYVYTFGTTVTKAIKQIINNQVPQIFTVVVDPVGAGIVRSMTSSGANIGGSSINIPLSLQIDSALKVTSFKTLGLLFNPREKNSNLVRDQLLNLAASRHFEIVDLRSPPAMNSLKQNLQKLKDRSIAVDAVFLPADSFCLTNSKLIGTELRAANTGSIAAVRKYVDDGALMGLVPDYYKLGKAAAAIVDKHEKGGQLADMAIFTDSEPKMLINMTTARALKVEIPENVLANATVIR